MFKIANLLYGQKDNFIRLWLYIFAHIEQCDEFKIIEISRVCNISRRLLYELITKGINLFEKNEIFLRIERPYTTSPTFRIIVYNPPKGVKAKKTKEDVVVESDFNPFNEIITHLNLVCNKNYRMDNKSAIKGIKSKLDNGFTIDDIKYVIEVKANHWLNSEQEIYLRPETLFGNKFETYLNEKPKQDVSTFAQRIRNAETIVESDWGILPKPE